MRECALDYMVLVICTVNIFRVEMGTEQNCYIVSDIPGSGRGLVATKNIKKGIGVKTCLQCYYSSLTDSQS